MEESDDDVFQFTTQEDSEMPMEKNTITDIINLLIGQQTTVSSDTTVLDVDMQEEDVTDGPPAIKFNEVISCDHANNRVDAYINYVFENFRPVSPRSMLCLDVIRSSFVQQRIHNHLENVVEDSTSHSQTCEYIRDVIDDVLQDLVQANIETFTPLTSSGKRLLLKIVKNRIFGQQVKMHVAKIIQKAVRQLDAETKRISVCPIPTSDTEIDVGLVKQSWSLENNSQDMTFMETVDPSHQLPKVRVPPAYKYAKLPRYLSAYKPHMDSSNYVAIPCLYNLPLYPTAPFPFCSHKQMLLSGGRTTRLGHSTCPVPTFYLGHCTTQMYSKLVKYYNSFK